MDVLGERAVLSRGAGARGDLPATGRPGAAGPARRRRVRPAGARVWWACSGACRTPASQDRSPAATSSSRSSPGSCCSSPSSPGRSAAACGALVDLRLLRHWSLASASLLLFLSGITLYGAMLLMPLYFQEVRGTTVLQAGLLLIPQGLGTLASRSLSGRLSDTLGARWLAVVGFLIVLLGTLPFAFADAGTSPWVLMAALFVRGVGLGAVTVPLMALGFRGLARQRGARREHHHAHRPAGRRRLRHRGARRDPRRGGDRSDLGRRRHGRFPAVLLVGDRLHRSGCPDLARAARAAARTTGSPPRHRRLRACGPRTESGVPGAAPGLSP